jgi:hypothetical protein
MPGPTRRSRSLRRGEALGHHLVECVPVVCGTHSMARLPGATAGMFPQSRVEVLAIRRVAADHAQPIALLGQCVEGVLLIGGTHPMPCLPGGA